MSNIAIIINNLSGADCRHALEGSGKTILEHTIEKIRQIKRIDRVFFHIDAPASRRIRKILNILEPLGISPIQISDEDFLASLAGLGLIDGVENLLFFNPVSPFIDPKLSDSLLSLHILGEAMFSLGGNFPSGVLPIIVNKELFSSINLKGLRSPFFFDLYPFKKNCESFGDSGELKGLSLFVEGPYSLALFNEFKNREGDKSMDHEHLKSSIEFVLADLIENFKDVQGKKFFNRMLNRIEMNKKSLVCRSYPIYMHIGLNSRCNLKCATCHHQFDVLTRKEYHDFLETTERLSYTRMFKYDPGPGLYKRKKNLDMKWGLYEKIAGSVFKYLREVRFGVNGETLLYKRLGPALTLARENGVDSSIVSNGMLLNEKTIPILLDGSLKRLSISIDSTRNSLLEKIRKGADLNLIIRNIKLLIDERERRNLRFPRVGFAFTAARENIEELPGLMELAASIGLDFVGVQLRYISNFMDPAESLYHDQHLCHKFFVNALKKSYGLKVDILLPAFGGEVAKCEIPWTTINVSHDGNAVPCCTMNISRSYGFLNGENFMKVWNGDQFVQFRESFRNGEKFEYQCKHCIIEGKLDFRDPLRFFSEKHSVALLQPK
ncbi:MAG: SPASM domain-containing protein [Nitrospinae bacterium]|nr:SPASM domain-containing protein [Nitrospinota bacterium]